VILVFGKTGQVAMELQRFASVVALGREDANLSSPQACLDAVRSYAPTAIINAAAYTDVDKAEDEEAIASIINGDAPTAMAQACAELGIPLIHISTDYVFDGIGEKPWQPNDRTNPQNAYGRSKSAGEMGIRTSGAVHGILRTSWIVSAHGRNFVKTMLRLSQNRDAINVVADQIGGPTPASDIAAACIEMAEQLIHGPSKSGTYHFTGEPNVSWADFANEIFEQAGKSVKVTNIPTRDYPTLAKRPLNSRMDCRALQQTFGIIRPDWRYSLSAIIRKLEAEA
jgi:dTDP-4-dehydrorhamnose reductase